MRLARTDVIAGLDATTAREPMRSLRTQKSLEYVRTRLPAGTDAAAVLTELVEAGFLTEEHGSPVEGDRWWVTTTRGNALGMASFAKPISRATAERLLAGLLDRARTWNENPERLVSIEEIVVFGSYLDPTVDQLGDVDIAVTIRNWPEGDVAGSASRTPGRRSQRQPRFYPSLAGSSRVARRQGQEQRR